MEMKIEKLCCYCGIRVATTKDHIPPRSIFNKPRPNDLITVPCCFECNNEASQYDERFKTYLGMHVARRRGEAERLFKERVLPTTKHNGRIRRAIMNNIEPVYLSTKSGIITGKAFAVKWDSEAHDKTIERMTRGLFYFHYGKIIPPDYKMKTCWFQEPPDIGDIPLLEKSIGKGAFIYRYNKVEEMDLASIWLYEFYAGHFAGAIIL